MFGKGKGPEKIKGDIKRHKTTFRLSVITSCELCVKMYEFVCFKLYIFCIAVIHQEISKKELKKEKYNLNTQFEHLTRVICMFVYLYVCTENVQLYIRECLLLDYVKARENLHIP